MTEVVRRPNSSATGLHLCITAELPFQLGLPTATYSLGTANTGASFQLFTNHSWVYGLRNEDAGECGVARFARPGKRQRTLLPNLTDQRCLEFLARWRANRSWDQLVALPAGPVFRFRYEVETAPAVFSDWLAQSGALECSVQVMNQFLNRYRMALGFGARAGRLSLVSELDLLDVTGQLYDGETSQSHEAWLIGGLPGIHTERPASAAEPEALERLAFLLREDVWPIAVTLAYDALALFYRRRYREAIVLFWTSLEMAVGEAEVETGRRRPGELPKGTVEERIKRLAGRQPASIVPEELLNRLAALRQFRNDFVHGVPGSWRHGQPEESAAKETLDLEEVIPSFFETLGAIMNLQKGTPSESTSAQDAVKQTNGADAR